MPMDTGVTHCSSSLNNTGITAPSDTTSREGEGGSAERSDNEGEKAERTDTRESIQEMASFLDRECDTKYSDCVPDNDVGVCQTNGSSEDTPPREAPVAKVQGPALLTAAENSNVVQGSSSTVAAGGHQAPPGLPAQPGHASVVPRASVSRHNPAEDKHLLMVDTSINSSGAVGPAVFTARRQKEILLARKARRDKFFSRVTFSNADNKYYSHLPVQPAMGWWKSVLSSRTHSLQLASRLARSLNVPIPDTVYACSTDCFYVSTRPDALQTKTEPFLHSTGEAPARNGWYIRSEFSAVKALETHLAARVNYEHCRYTRTFEEMLTFPAVASCPPCPTDQKALITSGKRVLPLRNVQSQKFEPFGRSSRLLPFREDPQLVNGCLPAAVKDSLSVLTDTYPAVVVKQAHYQRNDCNITKAMDLTTFSTIASDTSVERLYQAFVRGRPRSRCQLTRVCWSASRAPSGFTLVNKFTPSGARQRGGDLTSQYCVSCDNPTLNGASRACEEEERRSASHFESSFDVVPVSGSSLEAVADIARAIFQFTQNLFKLWLDSLVVDLVKSAEDGAWYFLQVKSFVLRSVSPSGFPSNLSHGRGEVYEEGEEEWAQEKGIAQVQDLARYSIPSLCHMCGLRHKKHELVKVVNQRMMLETQHHMRKRGLDVFFFTPGGRLQLSANCPVCSLCYSLYLAEKELIDVELKLARALHQPMVKDSEIFFSFTGIMDAIQCTLQPNDPYLLDLLRSFSNAPPRQTSFDRLGPEGSARGQINLQISPLRQRDSVLSFGNVSDERPRGSVDCLTSNDAGSPQRKTVLRGASASAGATSSSVETGGTPAPPKVSPSAPSHSSSNAVHCAGSPDTSPSAAAGTPSPPGAATREGARFQPPSSPSLPSLKVSSTVPRSIPIGATLVPPPVKTMRGGEAVTSTNGADEEKWRQIPPKLYQWRMMLFLHSLQDLPRGLLESGTTATGQHQPLDSITEDDTSELVIELKIFGESRAVAIRSTQIIADTAPPHLAASKTQQSRVVAFSGRPVRTESSERALCSVPRGGRSSGVRKNSLRWSGPVANETCKSNTNPRSAQYVPIKRMIVFYLFSIKPSLQQIFQQETLHFRLLASPRTAASATAEGSGWCTCISSPPPCPVCPLPSPPTCLTPLARVAGAHATYTPGGYSSSTSEGWAPLRRSSSGSPSCNVSPALTALSCIQPASCLHASPSDDTAQAEPGISLPRSPERGNYYGAGLPDRNGACGECGPWRQPPCLHAAATEKEQELAVEAGRPFWGMARRDVRPSTALPTAFSSSPVTGLTGTLYNGTAAQGTRSVWRPASADATTLVHTNKVETSWSGSPHNRPTSNSMCRYGNLCEVAAGSCSLQRLAGMRCSKQQTYVLLFSRTSWAQPRLRLVLGLHQDMQIPSQYVCVHPYADAYLPTRPYTSPCPLPSEWLDCYSVPSTGSVYASTSNSSATGVRRGSSATGVRRGSSATGVRRGSGAAGSTRPVSAYMRPAELHTTERLTLSAHRPL